MDLLVDFQTMFGVQNYDRTVVLEKVDRDNFAAMVKIQEDYQRIRLTIFPCFWENSPEDQRQYILHEFCHVFTHELSDLLCDLQNGKLVTKDSHVLANERATSKIANIIEILLLSKVDYAQKAYTRYLKHPKK